LHTILPFSEKERAGRARFPYKYIAIQPKNKRDLRGAQTALFFSPATCPQGFAAGRSQTPQLAGRGQQSSWCTRNAAPPVIFARKNTNESPAG
jgi:hypothetical protein